LIASHSLTCGNISYSTITLPPWNLDIKSVISLTSGSWLYFQVLWPMSCEVGGNFYHLQKSTNFRLRGAEPTSAGCTPMFAGSRSSGTRFVDTGHEYHGSCPLLLDSTRTSVLTWRWLTAVPGSAYLTHYKFRMPHRKGLLFQYPASRMFL
jgi:hypothetical protein